MKTDTMTKRILHATRIRRIGMNTLSLRNRCRLLPKLGSALLLLAGLTVTETGCDGGREGDRCNPVLTHNDCNDGLVCGQPATCAEAYCCPVNASSSSNPYCNGQACPQPDTGAPSPDTGAPGDDGSAESATPVETGAAPDSPFR
ncbi:MAG: hypothetical protein M3O36_04190 [Myxococcota bacterium]|nr:hypothetical protein [Myxococcota bacterium]